MTRRHTRQDRSAAESRFGKLSEYAAATLALLPALFMAGCSKSGLDLVPVQGQITLDGGPWPAAGAVLFLPQPGFSKSNRPAQAAFDADGHFQATTFKPGDGLLPGQYTVTVECWGGATTASRNPRERPSCIPGRFRSVATSPLTLLVPAHSGVPIDVKFDVPRYDN